MVLTRSSIHGRSQVQNAVQQNIRADEIMSQSDEPDDGDDERSEMEDDASQDERHLEEHQSQAEFSLNSSTAYDLLQPLQQTADRVSKQVEEFARVLDKFNADREHSEQDIWEDARAAFRRLNDISKRRLEETTIRAGGSRPSSRNRHSAGDSETEIQKLQLETNLWALTSDLLICNSPKEITNARASQETVLNGLHRYSLPTEIWNAFLDSDTVAQEYETILAWLQQAADISSPSVEDVLATLNSKAERGEGIWSAGYLYTKNAIKAQKRTRSSSKPLDPTVPGLVTSHIRTLDSEPLVTQMDPDAQAREGHVLLQQDDFHEQYAWQACWEFLRRGHDQSKVREWWAERKEVWRSVCLRANAIESDQQSAAFSRIMNIASNRTWSELCRQLCQDGTDLYTFQSAVYGVLAGELQATLKACRTIDDGLFAHFNALLIERYKLFLSAWDAKSEDANNSIYHPGPPKWTQVRQYLASCQADDMTRAESREALKAIQAMIMSQDFEAFFLRTGQAAAQVAHMTGENAHLMEKDEVSPKDEGAQITASDFDSVRMVVHLQLMLRALGYLDDVYAKHLYTVENNIANYIGWLQRENKFELIPLYTSRLSEQRIPHVLGAILNDVKETKDRELQVKLMKKYSINIPEVLWANFCLANDALMSKLQEGGIRKHFARIVEPAGTGIVKNLKIRPHFIDGEVTEEDITAIESVEWFQYTDAKNWGQACWAVAALYMTFLSQGRLAAAVALAERVTLRDTSLAAVNMNLNIAEASDDEDVDMDVVGREEAYKGLSPTKKRKAPAQNILLLPGVSRDQLAAKSLVWVQLEQLITLLNAFDSWNQTGLELDENRNNAVQVRALKKELYKYLNAIELLMGPLLEKDYLSRANDEQEAAVLDSIRNHYLPECILAYDSVLNYAGHALSRRYLVECMNLAQLVAASPTVTNAFIESKRMQELVTAFALDSKALLHAAEVDHGKKSKKDSGFDLWQIKRLTLDEPADLEALD